MAIHAVKVVDFHSKRHNKFQISSPAKAIYGSFRRAENEIFNVVNYKFRVHIS